MILKARNHSLNTVTRVLWSFNDEVLLPTFYFLVCEALAGKGYICNSGIASICDVGLGYAITIVAGQAAFASKQYPTHFELTNPEPGAIYHRVQCSDGDVWHISFILSITPAGGIWLCTNISLFNKGRPLCFSGDDTSVNYVFALR